MPLPSELKAVVFDVDGTLYRQSPVRRAMAGKLALAFCGNPVRQWRAVRFLAAYRDAQEHLRDREHATGNLCDAQFELACSRSGLAQTEARQVLEQWFHAAPLVHLARARRPGLAQFLAWAKQLPLALGILSDYPAERKLAALGLDHYFDVVVCSSQPEVNRFKPHAAGLLRCLKSLNVRASEAIFVGDRSEVDGACARAAGVHAVIIGTRPEAQRPADTEPGTTFVNDFHQLIALCSRTVGAAGTPLQENLLHE